MKTTKTIEKLKVTIKRPSGEIETIYRTDMVRTFMMERNQALCIKNTREAGKGDILSFEIVKEEIPLTIQEQRYNLVFDISSAWSHYTYLREQDFNDDIGFHKSPAAEKEAKVAEQALREFDIANPELAAEIAKKRAEETERSIQSALNA